MSNSCTITIARIDKVGKDTFFMIDVEQIPAFLAEQDRAGKEVLLHAIECLHALVEKDLGSVH